MKRLSIFVLLCLSSVAFAQTPDDIVLTKAMDACQAHRHNEQQGNGWVSKFNPGWEHCPDIEKSWESSAAARATRFKAATDEAERQRGIDLAKKLKQ